MTAAAYKEVLLSDLFNAENGKAVYIRDYVDKNGGAYPVYSASLTKPFGWIASYDYDGSYLTWVMNGYGGRVQEVEGKFSVNRDRGILIPKDVGGDLDLTYIRYAIEPELTANAVGRRVDGKLNEYTKIYPDTALKTSLQLPVNSTGEYDFPMMAAIGSRLRKIERAQTAVRSAREALEQASFALDIQEPFATLSLGDAKYFQLSIGKRILISEHSDQGIPAYSANVLVPFGKVEKSNLKSFDKPSILWGIDGNFSWNLIPTGHEFATTDHCGRVQILDPQLDAEYVYWYLKATRSRYGFDRVYRAKLENIKADVIIQVPLTDTGDRFSLSKQKALATHLKKLESARLGSIESLETVMQARISLTM